MDDLRHIQDELEHVLSLSALFSSDDLTFHVVLNPVSGALATPSRLRASLQALQQYGKGLVGVPLPGRTIEVKHYRTERVGHAHDIARQIVRSAEHGQHVIVSCGGDGTHGEILSALVTRGREESPLVFRAPFGTGNDGADARSLSDACNSLLGGADPARAGHLVVRPTGMQEYFGFNIASIGLDAYVGFLTDRLKKLPVGDLYRMLADIMTVFYDVIVGVGEMRVQALDEHGTASVVAGRLLLCAFGVSGFRVYGGGKQILPGFDNVCAIERMGLFRKLKLKGLVYRGEHQGIDKIHFLTARRLTIDYDRRVPLQLDGEPVWLEPENFPLTVEIHPPTIPILR